MKVLLVYQGLAPGGITTDLRNLERGLQAHGVEVCVAGTMAEVRRHVRGGDVLVHVFSCLPSITNFGAMALARARRLPLVWTPVFHPYRLKSWEGSGLLRVMEVFDRVAPRAATLADGVIAATDAEAEHLRRRGARRVEIIPPAVDGTVARPSPDARATARAEFGLGDEPAVLLVGRSTRRKGFPFAVAVLRALRTRLPEARLLVIGPRPDSDISREPGTIVPGFCDPERVAAAYDAADALVVPALYEQFSRAVIEAWSHELPPVVTHGVGLAPLVSDRAGLVAPFGDATAVAEALEEILTNAELARDYGTSGRALVEDRFLLADHVDRTIAFYRAVSKGEGSQASVSSHERPSAPDAPGANVSDRSVTLRERLRFHVAGLSLLAAVTIWLMRRFIFTTGLPAGTDMLGFISRSAQYASFSRLYDSWAVSSFGSRRVFNFDNIMGGLNLLVRNPVVTVKLVDVLTLFGAGLGAYALSWSWYRRRVAATTAGVLFMASQAVLTRWGSGLLNVEVVFSVAPVMLLTLSSCLERFTLRRAIGFTSTVGLGFLVRPDLPLWVAPFLILYVVIMLATREGFRARLTNLARTLAVAVPGVLLLNGAWLVPFAAGYRVGYETLNQLFALSSLQTRSLTWPESLLGLGREIGYFNFTGVETWYSYPWLPRWGYYAFAAFVPLLALAALRWHRDRRTLFLVLASVLATLLAPGTRAPLGGLYLWAAEHIPLFGDLRDPNRWLIGQAIAYALLASLTIDHVAKGAFRFWCRLRRQHASREGPKVIRGAVAVILVGIALVPVLPTFVVGLRTLHVTPSQQVLLDRLRAVPASDRVMSVPAQDLQFLVQGSYRGFEHDLGYESALFTGRQDIGDGGWDQSSANFAADEMTLLLRRDPAFSAMLASVGVSRVLSLNYPLIKEVANPVTGLGSYSEQRAASQTPSLTPILSNSAGTDDAIGDVTGALSFRPNVAVVLGGGQGAAALADQSGINLSDWAVFEADDIIDTGGYGQLLALIRKADLVLLADERPVDIAVEGTAPIGAFTGITSSPQLGRLIASLPSDQSAQAGSLNDVPVSIPQPQTTTASTVFSIRSPQRAEIWARVLASGSAATIRARVDGALLGSITPVTLGQGFQWVRMATVRLGAGPHQVTLSAVPSSFGDNYEVQQVRVLSPGALQSAEAQLGAALAAAAGRVAYAFDFADVAKWSWPALAGSLAPQGPAFSMNAWMIPTGTGTATVTTAPAAATAPQLTVRPRRPFYTFAEIYYKTPQDWADRPYVYLQFKGTDSGKVYQLTFDFGLGQKNEARYTFADDSKGWKTLAFPTSDPGPGSGATDWSRVYSVRIALPSKRETGTLALGLPRPSSPVPSLNVPVPVLPDTGDFAATSARTPECFGGSQAARTPQPSLSAGTLVLSASSVNTSCRIYVPPMDSPRQLPAIPVSAHRVGTERWSYSFSAQQPGALVWTQAYDPVWQLTGAGPSTQLPELSVVNGYLVGPGSHSGTIAFNGESSAIEGVSVSLLTALALLLAVIPRWRRARRSEPSQRGSAEIRWPGPGGWLRSLEDVLTRAFSLLRGWLPRPRVNSGPRSVGRDPE